MSTLHPFVQPTSGDGISVDHVASAAVTATGESTSLDFSTFSVVAHGHAPPTLYSPKVVPLRI
jgi:hypothetical protein